MKVRGDVLCLEAPLGMPHRVTPRPTSGGALVFLTGAVLPGFPAIPAGLRVVDHPRHRGGRRTTVADLDCSMLWSTR